MSIGQDMVGSMSARLDMLEDIARQRLTLIAPTFDLTDKYPMAHRPDEFFSLRRCPKCTPEPKVYRCPMCDFETTERWRMQNHNMPRLNELCEKRAAQKRRAWAANTGIDS